MSCTLHHPVAAQGGPEVATPPIKQIHAPAAMPFRRSKKGKEIALDRWDELKGTARPAFGDLTNVFQDFMHLRAWLGACLRIDGALLFGPACQTHRTGPL